MLLAKNGFPSRYASRAYVHGESCSACDAAVVLALAMPEPVPVNGLSLQAQGVGGLDDRGSWLIHGLL